MPKILIPESEFVGRGNPDCEMCQGSGVVSEGEYDDIREVPCPCTLSEEADFSGATEGDR